MTAWLRYMLADLAGRPLAGVRLCRVLRVIEEGRVFYRKRRYGYAAALIRATDILLKPNFRVLSEREWLVWEPQLYRLFYGRDVQITSARWLALPEMPGIVLADFLRSADDCDESVKLKALGAAIRALWGLHQTPVCFPGGGEGFFSHGDAIAQNVIYDVASNEARWFDFETMHNPECLREWRQADDLRAFTYSAASVLPEGILPTAAQLLVTAYAEPKVLRELRGIVERLPDSFHLGQTRIGYRRHRLWSAALQHELNLFNEGA